MDKHESIYVSRTKSKAIAKKCECGIETHDEVCVICYLKAKVGYVLEPRY